MSGGNIILAPDAANFLLDNHEGEGGDDHAEAPHQPDDGAEAGSGRESSDEEVIEFTKTLLTQSMNAPERAMSRLEIILTYVAGIVRQNYKRARLMVCQMHYYNFLTLVFN